MGRPLKMSQEQMLAFAQQCFTTECKSEPELLTAARIGAYIRAQGHEIGDHLVRRSELVREYINKMKNDSKASKITTVSVFRNMDIDEILKKNSKPEDLRKVLMERENYYLELTHSAAVTFEENRKLKKKVEMMEEKLASLESEVESIGASSSETLKNYKQVMNNNRVLKDIVDTYVYPGIANELLAKNGFIQKSAGYLDPEKVQENIIGADDSIKKIKSNVVRGLFSSIGGDLDDKDDK